MNNELKTILQSVIKEALQPIHEELQSLNNRLDTFEQKTNNNFNDVKKNIDKLSEKISVQHNSNTSFSLLVNSGL